jgi:hypothetical protein
MSGNCERENGFTKNITLKYNCLIKQDAVRDGIETLLATETCMDHP